MNAEVKDALTNHLSEFLSRSYKGPHLEKTQPLKHSLVIPVFNEEETLPRLINELEQHIVKPILGLGETVEVLLVDDGSIDASRAALYQLRDRHPDWVRFVCLSRNFGHQVAITAGMDLATGDTVTVMDADLQDPPQTVLQMIDAWRKGAEVVFAVRKKRLEESWFKKTTAHLFYRFLRKNTQIEIPLDTGDFRLMSRRAIDVMKGLREQHRFVRGLASWIGFKQTTVAYVRQARFAGETKYPLRKMLRLSWDALTGFSLKPLRLATYLGLWCSAGAIGLSIWAFLSHFIANRTVPGWTSIMVAVLFLGGVQLFAIGVLGEYVGRIFEESKKRPLYIVEEDSAAMD